MKFGYPLRAALFSLLFFILPLAAMAQGTSVAFGAIQQDTSLPVEVTSDSLEVDQETGTAIFIGNVIIGQGEMRLSADKVNVTYRQNPRGIERVRAFGNVVLVSGPDAAEASEADYDIDAGEIVMIGDVLLTQQLSALSGDRMVVDLNTGQAKMTGRVKSILQTGQGE